VGSPAPGSGGRIWPLEQVAHGLAPEQGVPAAALMLVAVVQHVAALTERRQVGVLVVGRVVVAVSCREHDPRDPDPGQQVLVAQPLPEPAALAVAPGRDLGVPPSPVAEVEDPLQVRASAFLAPAPRSAEADRVGELGPVDGVEEAVLRPDRHPCSPAPRALTS
jgi:hypothetical protein